MTDFMYGLNKTGKNPRKKQLLPEMKELWEKGAKGLKTGDVVAGKDAKILRAADKTGAKDMLTKITDAEGYSIDPTFQGDIFPNLSENQISMLDDFMKKTGAQSYEEAISSIMDLQGKETLWESLRGAYADNKLGETFKGEDADALKNFIAQLGLIGGGI